MKVFGTIRRVNASSLAVKSIAATLAALSLAGCETLDDKPTHPAGWTLLEPSQRHPILVSQQQHGISLKVGRHQSGLSSSQRAQFYGFLEKYRSADSGNSKVVVSVPAGSSNEVAAMRAVADMRPMLAEHGFSDTSVSIEPYQADGAQPPIRVSYMRFHAEGPECGRWPEDLTRTGRNTTYHNYGCAQQHNMAAMVANPADLVGPRSMSPINGDRRDAVYEKYIKGDTTGASRSGDERATRQQSF